MTVGCLRSRLPRSVGQQHQQQAPRPTGPLSPRSVDALARELEEPDDTMKNLRKTFAGIFGDM
jgi:hypothetical protein